MNLNLHEAEILRRFIEREVRPLLERIEKLEAAQPPQPSCHEPDDAFCMICNPPMPYPEGGP